MPYVIQELCNEIGELKQALSKKDRLIESLKQEAQAHAQEARTANHTIAEIYQVVSGETGEPGNWHGAEPVKQLMAQAVRFADGCGIRSDSVGLAASLFLTSLAVQQWRKEQGA